MKNIQKFLLVLFIFFGIVYLCDSEPIKKYESLSEMNKELIDKSDNQVIEMFGKPDQIHKYSDQDYFWFVYKKDKIEVKDEYGYTKDIIIRFSYLDNKFLSSGF